MATFDVDRQLDEWAMAWSSDWHTILNGCSPYGVIRRFAVSDWAALEWVMSGTHTGDFPGMPATSRPFASVRGARPFSNWRPGRFAASRIIGMPRRSCSKSACCRQGPAPLDPPRAVPGDRSGHPPARSPGRPAAPTHTPARPGPWPAPAATRPPRARPRGPRSTAGRCPTCAPSWRSATRSYVPPGAGGVAVVPVDDRHQLAYVRLPPPGLVSQLRPPSRARLLRTLTIADADRVRVTVPPARPPRRARHTPPTARHRSPADSSSAG